MAASELEAKYLHLIEAQKKLITFYQMNGTCSVPIELRMAVEEAERALVVFTSPYSLPEYRPMPLLTDSIDPMKVDQNVFLPPCLRGNISNGVMGLVNMGNTCFVNSTMQALMATEWLRNRILSMKPESTTPQPITGVIERFARCFWDNKLKSKSSVALPTSSIVHALPPWLGGFRQQDAQEFLTWLLDIMRDEAKAVIKANRDPVATSDRSRKAASQVPSLSDNCSLELTRKMADTWIDEIFGNLSVSTMTCSHCRATTEKYESNLMISLEIPLSRFKLPVVATRSTPSIRIQDCLDEYFNEREPEKIDDFACLNCTLIDRVTRATSAAQTVLLQKLPGLADPMSLTAEASALLSRCKEANLLKLEGQIAALLQMKDRGMDKVPLFQMQETLRRVQNKLDRLETTICLLQAGDRSIIHPGSDLVSTLFALIQSLEDILVEIDVISEIVAYMHGSASGLSPKTPPLISRPAFRKLSLQQQPGCLILQIKRFQMTAYSSVKLQHIINLAPEIDLAPYLTPDYSQALESGRPCASTRYQLFAVVEHQGQLSSGHYIAYVQKPTGWFRCSDSYVTPATLEQVLRSDAYLLFYQRY